MLKTLVAIHDGGNNDKLALILTLDYDPETHPNFDPESAIQAACAEFLHTDRGAKALEETCKSFNYGDFVSYVPDTLCKKHGFTIHASEVVHDIINHNNDLRPDDLQQ